MIPLDLAALGTAQWSGCPDEVAGRRVAAGLAVLRQSLRRPLPPALAGWAAELASTGGDLPLLGTVHRAGRFEALQWNAARHPHDPLLVAGVLTAPAGTGTVTLGRALVSGDAVTLAAAAAHGDGPAAADNRTLGCAAVIGLLHGDSLADVLDLAAGLMVLSAPEAPDAADPSELLRAGHPAATGWLACEAARAGLTGSAGAVEATLVTTTGPPTALPTDVDDVVAALS